MFEAIIRALITICLFALLAVLVIWVLGVVGIHLPPHVDEIIYVIFGLVCVLILYRILRPVLGQYFP